jgi:hypothetical protein
MSKGAAEEVAMMAETAVKPKLLKRMLMFEMGKLLLLWS